MLPKLREKLLSYQRKTITLSELEKLMAPRTYDTFAEHVLELEDGNYLQMVKSKGRNGKDPSLAYQYRINKHLLQQKYHQELQRYRLKLHNAIHMDKYFRLPERVWKEDLPYLEKIHHYLETKGFPEENAPAPERSYELVGDEKWITDHGGAEVLERVHLWDKMKIFPVSDPLMFAINPAQIQEKRYLHLIIENKTTYHGLLPALTKTPFSTLIYGSGNKIVKSIENFPTQFPVFGDHRFFYFGDLDAAGINIWHSLNQKQKVLPAYPFYHACLAKEEAYGKTNQRIQKEALDAFLTNFPAEEQNHILSLFENGAYYPQEVLKSAELQRIWEETQWNFWISKN